MEVKYVIKSAQEINERLAKEALLNPKASDDEESRRIVSALLYKHLKNCKTVYGMDRYSIYDLLAEIDNSDREPIPQEFNPFKIAFEVKMRSDDSTKYPSHTMDANKYQNLWMAMDRGEFGRAILASIWNDGVIWLSDVFNTESFIEGHDMNATTNTLEDTDCFKVSKHNRFWPKETATIFYYAYLVDTKGERTPIFSKSPINIQEANEKLQKMNNLF